MERRLNRGALNLLPGLNLDYNMVPSLHVALCVACVAAFCSLRVSAGRVALWLWAALIALSTMLTHQHHIIDVAGGWIVGPFSYRVSIEIFNERERNFNFANPRTSH